MPLTVGSNNVTTESRALRGGFRLSSEVNLRSSNRFLDVPSNSSDSNFGFRVASIPEPSAALMLLMAGGAWLLKRRRRERL